MISSAAEANLRFKMISSTAELLVSVSIHLNLDFLKQFLASNDERYFHL